MRGHPLRSRNRLGEIELIFVEIPECDWSESQEAISLMSRLLEDWQGQKIRPTDCPDSSAH
ncbi:hypothetical protein BDN67DRAFT_960536 [Paxillus ammoniavirescens]|nr:hypothetical protein BDN67DRAFT_960536 [Paxillus ammoniavirescens]